MSKITFYFRNLGFFIAISLFGLVLAQTGSYTQGVYLPKTNFCKINGCKLLKRTDVPPNFIETYTARKLGNKYELQFTWVNERSGWSFTRFKLSKPNSEFIANARSFLKDSVGLEASKKFSTTRCKTFDEFIRIYNETGVTVPRQGLTVISDGYDVTISCILAPLTSKIRASERFQYPQVQVIISQR